MNRHPIKSFALEQGGISKDVALGVPIVRMAGQEDFYVENYGGILEYTDAFMRIKTKIGQIHLYGRSLEILYFTADEMKVSGYVEKLEYHQGGMGCKTS